MSPRDVSRETDDQPFTVWEEEAFKSPFFQATSPEQMIRFAKWLGQRSVENARKANPLRDRLLQYAGGKQPRYDEDDTYKPGTVHYE